MTLRPFADRLRPALAVVPGLWNRHRPKADRVFQNAVTGWNALLATEAAGAVDRALGEALHVAGNLPYDKAMDAVFNEVSRAGGNWRRLFDGGHSLRGAWEAVKGARPDDSFVEEFQGYMLGLWNDVVTPRGLPLFTVDHEAFQAVAGTLAKVGIPSETLKDMLTFNGTELAGGLAGLVVVLLTVRRRDPEAYFEVAGYLGITGVAAGNPVVLAVALAAAGIGAGIAHFDRSEPGKLEHDPARSDILSSRTSWRRGLLTGITIGLGAFAGGALGAKAGVVGAILGAVAGAFVVRLIVRRLRHPASKDAKAREHQLVGLAAAASLADARLPLLAKPDGSP